MRWALSLVWLAVGVLAIAADARTEQSTDPDPSPAGRHEAPNQIQPAQIRPSHVPAPASGDSASAAPVPGVTSGASPAVAGGGQVFGLASVPRDTSDLDTSVSIAIPALGPGSEVDPPVIDPTSTLSEDRLAPRRWMTRSPDRQFKVAGYKSFVGSPYKSCEQLCLREAHCVAIEFRHSDNRCQLFDRREESATTPKTDIGFVRQQAAR